MFILSLLMGMPLNGTSNSSVMFDSGGPNGDWRIRPHQKKNELAESE